MGPVPPVAAAGRRCALPRSLQWSTPAPAAAPATAYYPPANGAAAAAPSGSSSSTAGPAASASSASLSGLSFVSAESGARSKAARKKMQKQPPGSWVCALCTMNNKATAREKCEMCEEPNPRAFDPPAPVVPVPVASAKAPAPAANGKKGSAAAAVAAAASAAPSVPTPAPATVVPSNVSASFRALSYENGLVTACNNLTFDEVLRRRLIGLPRPQMDLISKLKSKHSAIFLLNLETKEMWGVFEADGTGQLDLEPDAWAGQSYNGRKTSRFPAQCYFTVAADFESPLAERHYRDVIYSGSSKPREKIRILTAEETRALIKVFQAKSKMRKALGAVNQPSAPLSHVTPSAAASAAPAAASASAASASSASSSFVAAAQHSSANTSRRNSVDSTASGDDDGKKKGSSSVAAVAAKKNPKANQTCKRWLADECTFTDETCKFMHVATVCRAFQRGTCPKGERCPFVHDKVDREHYKHGRSYCQKTAVHDDAPASKSSAASVSGASGSSAAAASAAPKKFVAPGQPKDSLDSILSGLGSWKQKKTEPEPVAQPQQQEEEEEEAAAELEESEEQALDDAAAAADAAQDAEDLLASGDLLDDAAQAAEDEAQLAASANLHFDLGDLHSHSHSHHHGVYEAVNGAGSFMDGAIGFDAAQQAPSAAAAGWAASSPAMAMDGGQHYQQQDGSFYQSDLQSQHLQQQQHQQAFGAPLEEEFAWFTNFRQHIVAPALQALHAREQQTQHKIIGPD